MARRRLVKDFERLKHLEKTVLVGRRQAMTDVDVSGISIASFQHSSLPADNHKLHTRIYEQDTEPFDGAGLVVPQRRPPATFALLLFDVPEALFRGHRHVCLDPGAI